MKQDVYMCMGEKVENCYETQFSDYYTLLDMVFNGKKNTWFCAMNDSNKLFIPKMNDYK